MLFDDFLEIFKHSFHKCSLIGVKNLGKRVSDDGREYYRFIGKFEFDPPANVFDLDLEENKPYVLSQFRNIEPESSNCFRRQFTKKLLSDEEQEKVVFQYEFEIVPKNIMDFSLNRENQKMYLYVLGYGTF